VISPKSPLGDLGVDIEKGPFQGILSVNLLTLPFPDYPGAGKFSCKAVFFGFS
jgi:hypothetical protein